MIYIHHMFQAIVAVNDMQIDYELILLLNNKEFPHQKKILHIIYSIMKKTFYHRR